MKVYSSIPSIWRTLQLPLRNALQVFIINLLSLFTNGRWRAFMLSNSKGEEKNCTHFWSFWYKDSLCTYTLFTSSFAIVWFCLIFYFIVTRLSLPSWSIQSCGTHSHFIRFDLFKREAWFTIRRNSGFLQKQDIAKSTNTFDIHMRYIFDIWNEFTVIWFICVVHFWHCTPSESYKIKYWINFNSG